MINSIFSVAKRELLVILNYKFSFFVLYLVSFYIGLSASLKYLHLMPESQFKIDIYLVFFFLATEMVFSWTLSTIQALDHMRQRCIETMLATPLSIPSILLGKSLAIFALSYIPSLLCAVFIFVQLNLPFELTNIIFPSSIGWIIFLISPVLVFGIICLNGLMLMYFNQSQVGILINYGIFFLIFRAGVNFNTGIDITILGSYAIGLFGVFFLVIIGLKFLKKERIVLSL